ncbi:MAG: TrkH family potassium uptake protein [Flavobacteriales bacterium]|nr:TrkH family potassium uptake protein [Flavobacteriales bacterium]
MRLNISIIARLLGILLIILSVCQGLCIIVSALFKSECIIGISSSALTTCLFGILLYWIGNQNKSKIGIKKREGYLVVSLGWIFMSIFGSLPYIFTETVQSWPDAIFEAVSGFTTTGATIFQDIEAVPKGILFWRSMTQWIGGMGIIVMTIAIFPILGIGGMELFLAEAPGPTSDKIHPRINETAKRLWYLYIGLTLILILLLWIEGMDWYDAINHSFTTMATGGFSTKQASIAHFASPLIEYTIIVFMILAGTNYAMTYFLLKRNFKKVLKNDEWKTYLFIIISASLIIAVYLFTNKYYGIESSFRSALFQVVSIITTTGYITADYVAWGPFATVLLFFIMFIGGCAGSTSGGIKVVRHLVMGKNCILEIKRLLHPRAIIPVKLNGTSIKGNIISNVLVFILVYLIVFAVSTAVLSLIGLDIESSLGAAATSLSNVGPGLGTVGPVSDFSNVPSFGKLYLSGLMLLGRLELFTILIIITPEFWRPN